MWRSQCLIGGSCCFCCFFLDKLLSALEGALITLSLSPPLQRAPQTSTRTATSWSSGCLGPTTTRRSPHVKPPSIVLSLVSTATAAAACLSSAGPCPSLSSCLCRAGPGWPPDPPPPLTPRACAQACERAAKRDVASPSVCLRRLWLGGEVSGSCVCAHCVVTAGQSKTQKINKKFDVKRIFRSGGQNGFSLAPPDTCRRAVHVRGTPSAIGGHVFARASCVLSWVPAPEMQLRFCHFVAHCHCGEKQVWK